MGRHINEKSLSLIQEFEGLKLKAYMIPGEKYYTIGYGHSFDKSITADTVWTYEDAVNYLKEDLSKFEGYVEKYVKNVSLTDNQFGALVSYCFNRGLGKTDGSNGLRQLIKNSQTIEEYAENIVVYWGTAEKYKDGLVRRRKSEQKLFLTPDLASDTINVDTKVSKKDRTKTVQSLLNQLYGPIFVTLSSCGKSLLDIDGNVGNKTRAALTVWLQLYLNEHGAGLAVDGYYGEKTNLAASKYIAVSYGDTTDAGKLVATILYMYGYTDKEAGVVFTTSQQSALKEYQKDHNLTPDGVAGQVFFLSSIRQL